MITPFLFLSATVLHAGPTLLKPILCDGSLGSATCDATLVFPSASIRVHWQPVSLPIKAKLKANRNWCELHYEVRTRILRKKYKPEVCDKMMALFSEAIRDFPEGASPGLLHVNVSQTKPGPKEDEPQQLRSFSVHLPGTENCHLLYKKKLFQVHCDVITLQSFQWLTKFLANTEARLSVVNPLK